MDEPLPTRHDRECPRHPELGGLRRVGGDCVACARARSRAWGALHKELVRERSRAWAVANTDRVKELSRRWYSANADCQRALMRDRYLKNKEASHAQSREWAKNNAEKRKKIARDWVRRNPEQVLARTRAYQLSKINAVPRWADAEKIKAVYRESARLSRETGVQHHVDHVVPLQSKLVCGLHWHENLAILSAVDNVRKGNRQWPNMP